MAMGSEGQGAGPARDSAGARPSELSAARHNPYWRTYFAIPSDVGRPEPVLAPGARPRLPYLPALDGIRALAVLAVIVYHANAGWLPAGFLGVDVFFVLSGYLITALLLVEWRQRGALDLPAFWRRRARRLLPALYLLLLVTLAFCALFLRGELARQRSDALAAFGYVTNWYLIFRHQSYFEAVGRPSLLQHLWSLAVEEQFYLCWPLIVVAGLRGSRRRLLALIAAGIAASIALAIVLYQPDVDPSRIYYGTDTRAVELLAGAALACFWQPWSGQPTWALRGSARFRWLLDAIGFAAFGAVVWACFAVSYNESALYRGGFGLFAVVTAVLVAVCVHPAARALPRLLSTAPLRWLGQRSYAVYLWHWPIMMVTRPGLDVPFGGLPLLGLQVAAALAMAELSYRLVEQPVRRGALGRRWQALRAAWEARARRRLVLWGGAGAGIAAGVLALGTLTVEARPPAPPDYLAVSQIHTIGVDPSPGAPAAAADVRSPWRGTPTATGSAAPASRTVPGEAADPRLLPDQQPAPPSAAIPVITPTSAPTPTPTAAPQPTPVPTSVSTPAPTSTAVTLPLPDDLPPVTALGDSVMVGAADALAKDIPNIGIDAVQGRQIDALIGTARALRDEGKLGRIVVVHLGSNGPVTARDFDTLMQVLGARPVVVVNAKVPREWEGPNDAVIASGVTRYPNAVLIDWRADSAGQPGLFYGDGIHLRPAGAAFYANLIAAAIEQQLDGG